MALRGQIAVVTGASRGIGPGIALQLGEPVPQSTQPEESDGSKVKGLPSLEHTAKGERVFNRVERETNGKLDILVNNAFSVDVAFLFEGVGLKKFYEEEPELWDSVNNVGLRNHYFCSVYAARIMTKRGKGLIVNVSSAGGLTYLFSVPYGIGKCALDRMAADMAVELKPSGITCVSLWPGQARTQLIDRKLETDAEYAQSEMGKAFAAGETIEYSGKAVVALASDPNRMSLTGKILSTADVGDKYGFTDSNGRQPISMRSVSFLLRHVFGQSRVADLIPSWIKIPGWLMTAWFSSL